MHLPKLTSHLSVSIIAITLLACGSVSEREVELEVGLEQELNTLRAEYKFPGATAAVVTSDGQVLSAATGYADLESNEPMLPSSRMLAASIGKTFVSATVLSLVNDGVLSLDDSLSELLPDEAWVSKLRQSQSITLKHLLNHSSGVRNHVNDADFAEEFAANWFEPAFGQNPRELADYILEEPLLFEPGMGWSYSDTGYILIGLIIEHATGNKYYNEVTARFLQPLNLNSTSPSDHPNLAELAAGYMSVDNRFGLPEKTTLSSGQMAWNPAIEWTGGGLVSNSIDLAIWGKLLFEGQIMESTYLDELLDSIPIGDDDPETTFGLAVAIRKEGPLGEWYSHSGWIPGYTSSLRYYPEHKIAIAFQINTDIGIVDGSTDLYEKMASRLEAFAANFESQ